MKKDTRNYSKHHPRFRQNYADGGAINPALTPTPCPPLLIAAWPMTCGRKGLALPISDRKRQHPQPQLRISSVV
jgi:hypothetical protein